MCALRKNSPLEIFCWLEFPVVRLRSCSYDDCTVPVNCVTYVAARSMAEPFNFLRIGLSPVVHRMRTASELPRSTMDQVEVATTFVERTVIAETSACR